MRRADGDRHAGGDHAVGAEHADREVGDVHRAALAVVGAAGAAEQLAASCACVSAPLAMRVAVAAVGRGEADRCAPGGAHTPAATASWPVDRCSGPRTSADIAGGRPKAETPPWLASLGGVLEGADAQHRAQQAAQSGGGWRCQRRLLTKLEMVTNVTVSPPAGLPLGPAPKETGPEGPVVGEMVRQSRSPPKMPSSASRLWNTLYRLRYTPSVAVM